MTTQQEAEIALAEHRAVMAALLGECVSRPTEDQYEAALDALRCAMAEHHGGADALA